MRLSEFFADMTAPTIVSASGDPDIVGLTADSREVRPGYLFAALPGSKLDGRTYIDQALSKGASAILSLPDAEGRVHARAPLIADKEPRRRLARMAAKFYGKQPATVVAVTGTNGKTSVAEFTRQIWARGGPGKAASIGTLGLVLDKGPEGPSLTTPDPIRLHRLLADLAKRGVDHLAMEASSHGLDQSRLDGVKLSAAAFTNLTRDHLDYHGSMAAYRSAKLRLFDRVMGPDGTAVLNADSDAFEVFRDTARAAQQRIISFGQAGSDIRIVSRTPRPAGQELDLVVFGKPIQLQLPLIGDFQAWNALAALGLAVATGTRVQDGIDALSRLRGVRGRMEMVARLGNGAAIFVDYAHTPDALETVLRATRPHAEGALWCVFGCGGDRDPGKRPMMAERAAAFADHPVLTDDNPRSEDPAEIRRQALAGAPDIEEIGGRAEAIHSAISRLERGDVLVIAGKGHETGQEIMGRVEPFDDATVAREAAAARIGGRS